MHFWQICENNFEVVNTTAIELHEFFYFTFMLVSCEFQLFYICLKNLSVHYLKGRHASIYADAEMQLNFEVWWWWQCWKQLTSHSKLIQYQHLYCQYRFYNVIALSFFTSVPWYCTTFVHTDNVVSRQTKHLLQHFMLRH